MRLLREIREDSALHRIGRREEASLDVFRRVKANVIVQVAGRKYVAIGHKVPVCMRHPMMVSRHQEYGIPVAPRRYGFLWNALAFASQGIAMATCRGVRPGWLGIVR
jgi:hypothetical protein